MEHVWHHKVRHSGRFSLFRQGPFQRTPKWPKVTGTRGSWDLAISLKIIRLMSFAFFKVKMSVLERRLSGQKVPAAKPDDSNLSAGADMGERTERTNSCMLFSDLHTCTHITQDQCCTVSISVLLCLWSTHPRPHSLNLLSHRAQDKCSYEVASSCWSSARACPTGVC